MIAIYILKTSQVFGFIFKHPRENKNNAGLMLNGSSTEKNTSLLKEDKYSIYIAWM